MRPDILNPLFAEVEALKGVGRRLPSRWRGSGWHARSICCSISRPAGSTARR